MSLKIKWPLMLILALLMVLAMLRLGFWQLDRAAQKQTLLDQKIIRSSQPAVELAEIVDQLVNLGLNDSSDLLEIQYRFRKVSVQGRYLVDKSIYIDNQVLDGQVGYRVFTPMLLTLNSGQSADQKTILVNRGWLGIGESREQLPEFDTQTSTVVLTGRLNTPPAQPPLWDDKYAVAQGKVWAYLPIAVYAKQMSLSVLPLVIELAPEQTPDRQFKRNLAEIGDKWVAKHHGYAFQWFAMALVFSLACAVLAVRQFRKQSISE